MPNPRGERGLEWFDIDFKKIQHIHPLSAKTPICAPGHESQTLCTSHATDLVKALFHPDTGPIKIKLPYERTGNNEFTYQVIGNCSLALIDGARTNVCKVTYTQGYNNDYEHEGPYLEAQVYYKKPTGTQQSQGSTGMANTESKNFSFLVRYAQLVTISGNNQYQA